MGGGVFQQRRRSEPLFSKRLRVEEGFERGAGLALGEYGVHLAGPAQRAGRPHPGQHLTRMVVQHDDGTVFHMAALQFAQVLGEGLHGKTLQRGV